MTCRPVRDIPNRGEAVLSARKNTQRYRVTDNLSSSSIPVHSVMSSIHCTWQATTSSHVSSNSPEPSLDDAVYDRGSVSASTLTPNTVSKELAVEDLKLLHHFSTKTYATIDGLVAQQDLWQGQVVRLGFQEPFVLRGILSIAALHLAALNLQEDPTITAAFLSQASGHYNIGLNATIAKRLRI